MPTRDPGHAPRSSTGRSSNRGNARSAVAGIATGEVLENTVLDVLRAGRETGFKGVVDVQVEFRNTAIDNRGFVIALFAGNDSTSSSVSIKLATRVHLGDHDPPE